MIYPEKIKFIACKAILNEIAEEVPLNFEVEAIDISLHVRPESLKNCIQEKINETSDQIDTILLGYGLCSRSIESLSSSKCTIIIPKVHDCIGMLLGQNSHRGSKEEFEAGTYYLSKGWIESGDHLFEEFNRMCDSFGIEKATHLMNMMLKHYSRVAFIQTGIDPKLEHYQEVCMGFSDKFNLKFGNITGSISMIRQLLFGPWDENFIVLPPGETIDAMSFLGMSNN